MIFTLAGFSCPCRVPCPSPDFIDLISHGSTQIGRYLMSLLYIEGLKTKKISSLFAHITYMNNELFSVCILTIVYLKKILFLFNRQLCCSTIKSLFTNEGKHGGEATVEAVRLISYQVKDHNCQLHPDSIEV